MNYAFHDEDSESEKGIVFEKVLLIAIKIAFSRRENDILKTY